MSIASELTTLATNKANIKVAIQSKSPLIEPTEVLSHWPTSIGSIFVNVDDEKPVRFIDFDGTVLHSYTVEEAQGLEELPVLPTHDGLTCQGWNYTLQQMNDTISDTGYCDVGATYVPTDGKTHIHITVREPEYKTFSLKFKQSRDDGVEIDWGDGTSQTYMGTSTQIVSHQYSPDSYPQSYDVTLEILDGTLEFPENIMGINASTQSTSNPVSALQSMIDAIYLGGGITTLGNNIFRSCYSLKYLTLPDGVATVGQWATRFCTQLLSMVLPRTLTSLGLQSMSYCYGLRLVSIPPSLTEISAQLFQFCHSLKRIAYPSTVTRIQSRATNGCDSLQFVALPHSITYIDQLMFYQCSSFKGVRLPNSVTQIYQQAFKDCTTM